MMIKLIYVQLQVETAQLISRAKVTSIDNNKKVAFRLEQNLKRLNYKAIIKNKDIRNFSTQKTWSKIILDVPVHLLGLLERILK